MAHHGRFRLLTRHLSSAVLAPAPSGGAGTQQQQKKKKKAALFYDRAAENGAAAAVFAGERRARIASLVDLHPHVVTAENFFAQAATLKDVEVIFGTWGIVPFTDKHFAAMPNLKAVFYAAGNVRAFAQVKFACGRSRVRSPHACAARRLQLTKGSLFGLAIGTQQPLIDRGVVLTSAWGVNAIPVAEMCLSQILLSLRGYFRAVRNYKSVRTHAAKAFPRPGINGETVGLLGLGRIGRRLVGLLKHYPVHIIAYDPTFTRASAMDSLGVELVDTAEEVFKRAAVVSNHTPDLPSTRGTLGAAQFKVMRDGATFVQSGRGAQVVEADLIATMAERTDLTALLDVTWPEPPEEDSPLWKLPNVVISPHVGGTVGDEVSRTGEHAIGMFEMWAAGKELPDLVDAKVLAGMG